MNPRQAVTSVLGKYATFRGVASRSEYWWWTAFTTAVSMVLNWLSQALSFGQNETTGASTTVDFIRGAISLAFVVPSLAVQVRRFHDAGFSGKWLLLSIIPIVAVITVASAAIGALMTLANPALDSGQQGTILFALLGVAAGPMILAFAVWVFCLVITLLPSKSAEAGNKHTR